MKMLANLVSVLFLLSAGGVLARELEVAVQPEKERYGVGEPVILRCDFSNGPEEPAVVDFGLFDAMNVSFVVNDGTPQTVTKEFGVHRGGGTMLWPETLKPGAKCVRYLVLDLWHRAEVPGVIPMRLIVKTGERRVTGRFVLTIAGRATAEELRAVVNALATKGEANYAAKEGMEMLERRSYDEAVLYALSYLTEAPWTIWEDVKKSYAPNSHIRRRMEEARQIGPGGRNVLD